LITTGFDFVLDCIVFSLFDGPESEERVIRFLVTIDDFLTPKVSSSLQTISSTDSICEAMDAWFWKSSLFNGSFS
jgi:hypothetical protein